MKTTKELLDRAEAELIQARRNIVELLRFVGQQGRCRSCAKEIFWVTSTAGKRAPFTRLGISHFADCPHARSWRKREPVDSGQGELF